MNVVEPCQLKLKDGRMLSLERLIEKDADLTMDQNLGVAAFVRAYRDTSDEEVKEHFEAPEKISSYYHNLIEECDIQPFREGKLIWIRAFLDEKFVGWMGLEANFTSKNKTYISTFVIDPTCDGKDIGEKMITSIVDHWLPETDEINLVVRKINQKALGFFQRFGFSPAMDIDHPYVDNPLHCMFMRWKKHHH